VKALDENCHVFLLLYVDDMLIAAKSIKEVDKLKALLQREFEMKDLRAARKILGMEILWDKKVGVVVITEAARPRSVGEVWYGECQFG
jgi:hypothetical protein